MILLLFWEFNKINQQRYIYWIRVVTVISFVLFWGGANFVGRDVFVYYDIYKSLPTLWNWDIGLFVKYQEIEVGFRAYMVILKSVSTNFHFFLIINSLINAIILDRFFKRYSKYYVLAFILYIVLYGHIFELEQIRNAKGLMLFLLSIPYLEKRKFIPFLILNLIGTSLHFSSVIYIVAYFFIKRTYSVYFYVLLFIIANIIFIFQIPILEFSFSLFEKLTPTHVSNKLVNYFNNSVYNKEYGFSLGFFERTITYILVCFIFKKKLISQNKSNIIFINLFVLFFLTFFTMSELVVAVVRVSALFYFSYALVYSNMFYELKNSLYKQIFIVVFITYVSMRFVNYHIGIEYRYNNIFTSKVSIDKKRDVAKKALKHWEDENRK